MFEITKHKYLFFSVFIILFGECLAVRATTDNNTVYVWDFSKENLSNKQKDEKTKKTSLTTKLTLSFEQELISAGCFTVLQRREYSKILVHAKQEKAISRIADLPDTNREVLANEANMVVFGQLYDEETYFRVSVTFEAFNGKIHYTGKVYLDTNSLDIKSIDKKMVELVIQICNNKNVESKDGYNWESTIHDPTKTKPTYHPMPEPPVSPPIYLDDAAQKELDELGMW